MTNSNIRSTCDMRNAFSQYNSSTSQSRTFCPNQPPYVQSIVNEVRPGWPVHTIQQGPTNSQLAARQVLSRELPIFSGDPEDWPMFYSSFKNTTEVCGYSDAENLARLQRCLRGHALETVKSRLLLPASVPNVMETLHKLYGRPEILINSLLKKLRSVAPPKAESLSTIITYGLAVQNLVDHIIIAGQHAHLWNPMLLQEMVEKLPASIKIQWGCFKQTRENVNLATFNEFMAGLVNLASDLTLNVEYTPIATKSSKIEKAKQKEKESTVTSKPEAEADKQVIEILNRTVKRKGNYFESGLLWKYENPVLPNSLPLAQKSLASFEKRLTRNPVLRDMVKQQLEQYQQKGYAHKASKGELENTDERRVWYLPLGVVTNPNKPNKIRLVWDAAARVNGVSFNDMLLKGPDLLNSLPVVLTRFRQRNIAVSGDIREMFHQIPIREEDKQSQRFLWRDNPVDPAQIFIMDVATFGATCSPCIAQFVKTKTRGTNTIQEANQLIQEVKNIHAAAGFEIGKFLSNSPEVLNALSESQRGSSKCMNLDKQADTERVLGLTWVPSSDVFTYDAATKSHIRKLIENRSIPTKRQVLRTVMTLFDPLGFIAHFVVNGKVLMQDIWRSGTDWDVPIDDRLQDRWLRWSELIEHLEDVEVPRCFFQKTNFRTTDNIQLHIFVDESEIAYACVGYLRFDDKGQVALYIGCCENKSRTIDSAFGTPSGHDWGKRSLNRRPKLRRKNQLNKSKNYQWLRSDSRKYHPFVAFRIGEILSITSIDEWRHVPSKINVADDATKWGDGPSFKPEDRWFSGPDFLFEPEYRWPSNVKESSTTNEELRAVYVHHNKFSSPLIDVSRFSNWNRMLRATAYVHRAVNIMLKRVSKDENSTLLSGDLQRAEVTLWRQVQTQVYSDEVVELNVGANHTVNKSSPLYKLSPFLDELGIIKMGSRIGAAPEAPYAAKYPIILPKDHLITFLLTDSFHRRFLHANGETVFNEMRQLFYISNLRSLIRQVTKECQLCKVKKAQPAPDDDPAPENSSDSIY
ncbi:uncharacterized protein LOC129766588 [Toxorhynchites rutilus septentrionalis]|uniref:uncharacterized protein LOC129766588 n=1 Tax=Toxorhynchites rutilus septentrionalis TaxID=329112 RepID=UPI0024793958|nr:uncharacterized protein LOC129766588 [Toxorhynchites rutilus septentrionalis]